MRSSHDGEVALNVVPLVDVTFLLMIFFVIAGSFDFSEGALRSQMRPIQGGGGTVALPLTPIVVRLASRASGDKTLDLRLDPLGTTVNSFSELVESLVQIRGQPGFDSQTPVVIQADDDVAWDHVVNGWNAALRAGYSDLAYAAPIR